MDQRDIQQLLEAGLITTTINVGDIFMLARPNNQRGDDYSILTIKQSDLITQILANAPVGAIQLLGSLKGANMNTTSDQLITLGGGTKFIITEYLVGNASVSLTVASDLAIYDVKNRGGNKIFLRSAENSIQSESLRALVNNTLFLSSSDNYISGMNNYFYTPTPTRKAVGTSLYASLGTPQGAAATADIYVYGYILA